MRNATSSSAVAKASAVSDSAAQCRAAGASTSADLHAELGGELAGAAELLVRAGDDDPRRRVVARDVHAAALGDLAARRSAASGSDDREHPAGDLLVGGRDELLAQDGEAQRVLEVQRVGGDERGEVAEARART